MLSDFAESCIEPGLFHWRLRRYLYPERPCKGGPHEDCRAKLSDYRERSGGNGLKITGAGRLRRDKWGQ